MLSFFLNPMMLLGLAGVALPVIAHLLSRRRYDVVDWAAMQFLNPSRKTRRRMRLEELLLLLVRIGIIALVALAASRPWISSGFLTGYRSGGSRDIVLVIDGSNSMSRSDGLTSLHQKAIRRAKEFLATLKAGDTATVIDARDQPIRVIKSPLQDMDAVSTQLDTIPPAGGAADLRQACEEAVGLLSRCSNGSREIVVLTDRQRAGWSPGEDVLWTRFDDVLKFPTVRPDVWVMDLSQGLSTATQNLALGRVEVSRDLSVPGFPVQVQAPVRNTGANGLTVPIQISINGQRMAELDSTVTVPAEGEVTFSRSLKFTTIGTNLVTVNLKTPSDSLTVDNESHAAVFVKPAIPALLIETSKSLQKTKWNTFFAEMALSAPGNKAPWVVARIVRDADLTAKDFENTAVAILPDVASLSEDVASLLSEFVDRGNGAFISLGPNTTPETFKQLFAKNRLFPSVELNRIRAADPDQPVPTTIAPFSLEANWLTRFRDRKGASLLQAEFRKWWLIRIQNNQQAADEATDAKAPELATLAQLTTGDPLLLKTRHGSGSLLLMTSNLNANWNALPTTPDYVPFLHEALFQMAASSTQRNVEFGQPLLTRLSDKLQADEIEFLTPFDEPESAVVRPNSKEWTATLESTRLPGIYGLRKKAEAAGKLLDRFVVNYDHSEDDPTELDENDRTRLAGENRMSFVEDIEALKKQMYGGESRSELWALLLWLFLGLLMLEVWMTRRLVQRGHADAPPLAPE